MFHINIHVFTLPGFFITSLNQVLRDAHTFLSGLPVARKGIPAIDMKLHSLDGNEVSFLKSHVQHLSGDVPLILMFGSYTWSPFVKNLAALEKINQLYCSASDNNGNNSPVARMLMVYTAEFHTSDGWSMDELPLYVNKHTTLQDRMQCARMLIQNKKVHNISCDNCFLFIHFHFMSRYLMSYTWTR